MCCLVNRKFTCLYDFTKKKHENFFSTFNFWLSFRFFRIMPGREKNKIYFLKIFYPMCSNFLYNVTWNLDRQHCCIDEQCINNRRRIFSYYQSIIKLGDVVCFVCLLLRQYFNKTYTKCIWIGFQLKMWCFALMNVNDIASELFKCLVILRELNVVSWKRN